MSLLLLAACGSDDATTTAPLSETLETPTAVDLAETDEPNSAHSTASATTVTCWDGWREHPADEPPESICGPVPTLADDIELFAAAALATDDLPPGWSVLDFPRRPERCPGVASTPVAHPPAHIEAHTFRSEGGATLQSATLVYDTASDAEAAFAYQTTLIERCAAYTVTENGGEFTLTAEPADAPIVSRHEGLQGQKTEAFDQDGALIARSSSAAYRIGRIIVQVSLGNPTQADTQLFTDTVDTATTRLYEKLKQRGDLGPELQGILSLPGRS